VTVEDVPAEELVRVSPPSDSNWSATIAEKSGRKIRLALSGKAPLLSKGEGRRRIELETRLFFQSDEVRLVKLQLTGAVVDEWEFPDRIILNPLTAAEGRLRFELLRHTCEDDASKSSVTVGEGNSPTFVVHVGNSETRTHDGLREERIPVTLELKQRQAPQESFIRLLLSGKGGKTQASIPVQVSGFGS
jgi:hypothetical protein